jgi:hypothetical protein
MPAQRRVFLRAASILVAASMLAATSRLGYAGTPTSWPPSSQLLLAEVVTGGASASDEYVEITNAGPTSVDLGGCDLIYVTATGGTTTRKALFASPLLLDPGRHLLVANAAGVYGPRGARTEPSSMPSDGARPRTPIARDRQLPRLPLARASSADQAATAATYKTRTTTQPTGWCSRTPSRSRSPRPRCLLPAGRRHRHLLRAERPK